MEFTNIQLESSMSPSSIRCVLSLMREMWGHLPLFLSLIQTTIGKQMHLSLLERTLKNPQKKKANYIINVSLKNIFLL